MNGTRGGGMRGEWRLNLASTWTKERRESEAITVPDAVRWMSALVAIRLRKPGEVQLSHRHNELTESTDGSSEPGSAAG
ncbi:Hypothetical protein SMAX5B_016426 [Scophthalmus maximus]|uniref:Uncharacterized protein n=1 Tax=Scophthalmus maximus TaxID=52904 RepID=A0A2U9BDW4_SCOMX|nr:Hypothetical protein SMAX5B_016426 [Scophthalmus maximus]